MKAKKNVLFLKFVSTLFRIFVNMNAYNTGPPINI